MHAFATIATALLATLSSVAALQSTKPATNNKKQAAQLQAAAVFLKEGNYVFENVATKQKLYYVPKGNHIYPAKVKKASQAAKMGVTRYTANRKVPWSRFHFGSKNKCLSSAWGGVDNDSAVAYVCASGQKSKKTTLERTKQWWLTVPVSRPTVNAPANSYANSVLLAAQSDSIKTRNKKIQDQQNAFKNKNGKRFYVADVDINGKDDLYNDHVRNDNALADIDGEIQLDEQDQDQDTVTSDEPLSELSEHMLANVRSRVRRTLSKRTLVRRAKTAGAGTYYIIATDHLIDMPARALTGKVYKARGIKSTTLDRWKKGQRNQQWKLIKA
ncbi:hypothetical protein OIV83_004227 [Microbotryomycetes sp. JL201]|nr:hypothetical protein OIV83_004227 [Microbotryomycetes sp. JL201]